ncbi:MAG: alpha/beta fold hydrolase [Candidatus Hydrogenedentes bacterium]|nr:alpha/beta fold hydrolase [Candidatus Hydrogenedentota bacterium]
MATIRRTLIVIFVCVVCGSCGTGTGADDEAPDDDTVAQDAGDPEDAGDPVEMNLNLPVKTMGGKQFWSDVAIYGGWRIQENVITGHCRLLDKRDVRRAWGSLAQCRQALEDAKERGEAVLSSRKLCVLLHGFLRSKDSFKGLVDGLREAGYEVYAVNYASTRFDIDTFAAQVESLLAGFASDFDEIHVVTHSMGGLVARRALSGERCPERMGRLVMVAPPNQGAVMADLLLDWWPSEHVTGPAGKQLATGVESFAKSAGTPACEFGVLAGARGDGEGWNPLIPGDDDGVVELANTGLEGMADFVVVPALHTVIMNTPESVRQVVFFLEHGRFDHGDGAGGAAEAAPQATEKQE